MGKKLIIKDFTKQKMIDFASYLNEETFLNNKKLTEDELSDYFDSYIEFTTKKHIILTDNVNDWIEEWWRLFPEKTYNSAGKALRTSLIFIRPRMIKFIRIYGFSKEIIFDATRAYLKYWKARNYAYCRTSMYFIEKQNEGSDLYEWCNRVTDGEFENVLTDEQVVPSSDFI